MPSLRPLPPWIRRGLEAGVVAGIVAVAALVGAGYGPGAAGTVLPGAAAGILVLAPVVLALGVVTIAYPVAFAATRSDALLGAVTAFLIGADIAIVLASGRVVLADREVSAGLLAAGLALGPAVVGLGASQLVGFGFGRRPGGWAAITSLALALVVLAIVGGLR